MRTPQRMTWTWWRSGGGILSRRGGRWWRGGVMRSDEARAARSSGGHKRFARSAGNRRRSPRPTRSASECIAQCACSTYRYTHAYAIFAHLIHTIIRTVRANLYAKARVFLRPAVPATSSAASFPVQCPRHFRSSGAVISVHRGENMCLPTSDERRRPR